MTKTELKQRGWTDAAIKRFAGEPDSTVLNPTYRKAPSMLLYALERIEKIEAGDEFIEWYRRSVKRKESAGRAVDTKRSLLLDQVNEIKIHVRKLPPNALLSQAIQHYNENQQLRAVERKDFGYEPAFQSSDPDFLSRIQVNYLRHEVTAYDEELAKLSGKVGKEEAYRMIREKVLGEIAVTYPYLAAECSRQLSDPS